MTIWVSCCSQDLKLTSVCLTDVTLCVWVLSQWCILSVVEIEGHAEVACVCVCVCVCVYVCVCVCIRLYWKCTAVPTLCSVLFKQSGLTQVYCALGPHLILWRGVCLKIKFHHVCNFSVMILVDLRKASFFMYLFRWGRLTDGSTLPQPVCWFWWGRNTCCRTPFPTVHPLSLRIDELSQGCYIIRLSVLQPQSHSQSQGWVWPS